MNKSTTKSIIKKIEKHMAQVGRDRDKLDEFIDELAELKEDCERAYDCLQEARDALSEMV